MNKSLKLEMEPDKLEEKSLLIERLYGNYSYNGFVKLVSYIAKDYFNANIDNRILNIINENKYLEHVDVLIMNEKISAIIDFEDVQKIIDNAPPDTKINGYNFDKPFYGYYLHLP